MRLVQVFKRDFRRHLDDLDGEPMCHEKLRDAYGKENLESVRQRSLNTTKEVLGRRVGTGSGGMRQPRRRRRVSSTQLTQEGVVGTIVAIRGHAFCALDRKKSQSMRFSGVFSSPEVETNLA